MNAVTPIGPAPAAAPAAAAILSLNNIEVG
jgi:hypothetical protein